MSKWYDHVEGKEKIEHMFGGDFPINHIYLDGIGMYDRIITCTFLTNYIPLNIPKKWEIKNFTAISFTLQFSDVENININGDNLFKKTGDLRIDYNTEINSISFQSKDFNFTIHAKYISLNEIKTLNIDKWHVG